MGWHPPRFGFQEIEDALHLRKLTLALRRFGYGHLDKSQRHSPGLYTPSCQIGLDNILFGVC